MAIIHADERFRVSVGRKHDRSRGTTRWTCDSYFAGGGEDSRARATFKSESAARRCADELWQAYLTGELDAPADKPETLGELVDAFCRRTVGRKGRPLSPKTIAGYRRALSRLCALVDPSLELRAVRARHLERFILSPAAPASKASYLRVTRALFRWGMASGFCEDVSAGIVVDAGPPKIRPYLDPSQISRFLDACTPATKIRAGLIIETGLRAGEAAALRWDWIRSPLGRASISLPAVGKGGWIAKGRRVRSIPLSSSALGFLDDARAAWPRGDYVLHDRDRPVAIGNWWRAVARAAKAAGLPHLDTHGLRRTAATRWIAAGVDLFTVSLLLGHQSVATTERAYAGISGARLIAAIDMVDSATPGARPGAQSPDLHSVRR